MLEKKKQSFHKIIGVLLLLFLTINAFSKTIISGKIDELMPNQVLKLAFFTNRIDYEEKVMYTKITQKGNFYFEFELDIPRTFHLKYNDIISDEFFVAPDDSLVIETTLYSDLIAINSGVDKLINIRKPAYDYDEKKLNKEIKKWAKNPIHYFEVRRQELTPTQTYSKSYASYSTKLIDYRLAYDKMRFALIAQNLLSQKQQPHLTDKYYTFMDTLDLNDVDFLETEEYQYMIMAYMHHFYKKENPNSSDNRFPIKYELAETLLEGKVKEFYQTVLLFNAYEQGKAEENKQLLEAFLEKVQDAEYKQVLIRQEKNLIKIAPLILGENAPLFELKDQNGYTVPFNSFLGKVVYLEFWASWCVPCLQQLPYAKEIKEQYKDVVFMYISLDEHEEDWKKMIEKKEITGIHLRINPTSEQDLDIKDKYHIDSIPTYFIIDKNGKLVSIDAPRPSDKKQLQEILNSLL